jgi:hypothetical protein
MDPMACPLGKLDEWSWMKIPAYGGRARALDDGLQPFLEQLAAAERGDPRSGERVVAAARQAEDHRNADHPGYRRTQERQRFEQPQAAGGHVRVHPYRGGGVPLDDRSVADHRREQRAERSDAQCGKGKSGTEADGGCTTRVHHRSSLDGMLGRVLAPCAAIRHASSIASALDIP